MEQFVCVHCEVTKAREEFGTCNRRRRKMCKICCAAAVRKTYRMNIGYRQKASDKRKARALEKHRFLYQYVRDHPCVDCGETDPLVLQFDHVIGNKSQDVPGMSQHSLEKIIEEIAKCVIRCANCHARKTACERNSIRFQLTLEDHMKGAELSFTCIQFLKRQNNLITQ